MDLDIPGYTVIRKIGYGGSATVYLAVQENLNRRVALKVLHNSVTADPSFKLRFQREARIVAQLNHINIVPVHDIGQHDNIYYMALEYLPDGDLRSCALEMSLAQLLQHMISIGKALQYAHAQGYVHRDIKAENILFRGDAAVLSDFGIARPTDSLTNMTVDGALLGTPAYMSPEQIEGKTLDSRSDLYSMGILLFEMLSGHLPLRGDSMISIGLKHLTGTVPLLPPATSAFQPLIDSLLAKTPGQRPADATQVIEQLASLLKNKSVPTASRLTSLWSEVPPDELTRLETGQTENRKGAISPNNSRTKIAVTALIFGLALSLGVLGWVIIGDRDELQNRAGFSAKSQTAPSSKNAGEELVELSSGVISSQLLRAQTLVNKQQLITPDNDNALSIYRDVLNQAPDNALALQGEQTVFRRIVQHIESAIGAQQFNRAEADIEKATQLWPENSVIARLRGELEKAMQTERQLQVETEVAKYLRLASRAIAHQQWTKPEQANALWYYQQSLALDPDNQLAKSGIDGVTEQTLIKAQQLLSENKFQEAQQQINKASEINIRYAGISLIQEQLEVKQTHYRENLQRQKSQASLLEKARALNTKIVAIDQRIERWIESHTDYSQGLSEADAINADLGALLDESPDNMQLLRLSSTVERHLETLALKQKQAKEESQAVDPNRFHFGNF